jgi:hypothetical protein
VGNRHLCFEQIIKTDDLGHKILGWGIFGYSAGYRSHLSWREDSLFLSLKTGLHDCLQQASSVNAQCEEKSGLTKGAESIGHLARELTERFIFVQTCFCNSSGVRNGQGSGGRCNWGGGKVDCSLEVGVANKQTKDFNEQLEAVAIRHMSSIKLQLDTLIRLDKTYAVITRLSLSQLAQTSHADLNHDISPHDFEFTTNVKSSHNPYSS